MTKETKALKGDTAEMMAVFEAYREANDTRLAEMEKKGASDPLTDERLARIDRRLVAPETWRLSGLLRGQGGSVSGAAEAGARFVLLDGAVEAAALASLETGMELIWKAGAGETQTERFDNRAGLPWQPCQLRVRGGEASWVRRGREIADSWSFPEAPNEGRFAAEFDTGSGFGGRIEVEVPSCSVPPGTLTLRVAEIGPDGRTGPWLSIGPGSPYL